LQSVFLCGDSKQSKEEFQSSKELTLSKIYQVPIDIITQGLFDEIKQLACNNDKWLLVNIQSDGEFQSHLLNRDVFSDDSVKELIKCKVFFDYLYMLNNGINLDIMMMMMLMNIYPTCLCIYLYAYTCFYLPIFSLHLSIYQSNLYMYLSTLFIQCSVV